MEVLSIGSLVVFLSSVCLSGLVAATKKYYMEDQCGIRVDMAEIGEQSVGLELTKFEEYYSNMDCLIRVTAPQGKQLMVKIVSIEVDCSGDYLRFYDGIMLDSNLLSGTTDKICGKSDTLPVFASTGSNIIVVFRSDNVNSHLHGFRLVITAFRTDEDCQSGEFRCSYKGRCISETLQCDGDDNCGDNSDECLLSVPAIIGICIAVGVTIVVVIIAVIMFRRRRVKTEKAKRLNSTDSATALTGSGALSEEPSILKPDPVVQKFSQPLFAIPRYPVFVPILESHNTMFTKSTVGQEDGGPLFMTSPMTLKSLDESVNRNQTLAPPPPYMLY